MRWCFVLCLAVLAGCSGMTESKAPPTQSYILRATATEFRSDEMLNASLRVARPLPGPGLDSERIVLIQSDHRLDYFSASRWAATAPEVIEALTVDKLRSTGAWSAVQDSRTALPSDYSLQIVVRRFDADYTEDPASPVIHVSLDCTIGRRVDNQLIASFTADATEHVAQNRLSSVVEAFERATNKALATAAARTTESVKKWTIQSPP